MSWIQEYQSKVGGDVVQAARLTKQNAEQLAEWCAGQVVTTYDAIDFADAEGEVGINFDGLRGMERVGQNEFLVKFGLHEFKRVAANYFLHVYEPLS